MTTVTVAHPVMAEASVQAVARATGRLANAFAWLALASHQSSQRAQAALQRRRDAQRVMEMARQFDNSQPGFASDLRMAAMRAMDE
jgi:hypothetical protein